MKASYPLAERPSDAEIERGYNGKIGQVGRGDMQLRGVRTHEFREPMGGEWYLSGADPACYKAKADLSNKYQIVKLVRCKRVTYWKLEG